MVFLRALEICSILIFIPAMRADWKNAHIFEFTAIFVPVKDVNLKSF
jgi:hypothetical protein